MEIDNNTILVISLLIITIVINIFLPKFKRTKQKGTKKEVIDNNINTIKESYEISITILKNQLELAKNENLSLIRTNSKLKGLEKREIANKLIEEEDLEEDFEESEESLKLNYEIDMIKGAEYAKSFGITLTPELLSNPLIMGQVWKQLANNKDMAIQAGILVPRNSKPSADSKPELLQTSSTPAQPSSEIENLSKVMG